MPGRIVLLGIAVVVTTVLAPGEAAAQVTLADDIILATQGKENAERKRRSSLGHPPGTAAIPYRQSPGSDDIDFGTHSARPPASLPRLARLAASPSAFRPPSQEPAAPAQGLRPRSSGSTCRGPRRWPPRAPSMPSTTRARPPA